jgi:NDP-mannose synthase
MKAVILAGGKGRRLRPYTTTFPKPLMPIGDKPILEIILRQLKANGVDQAIMAVGHLAELIMAFFGDGSAFGLSIHYSREDTPLGTAGCLGLIKDQLDAPFLMMNGDIVTTLDYSALVEYHKQSGAAATIALNKRCINIDFGVVETDAEQNIIGYHEKPTIEQYVSMGIYVFDPRVLTYIQPNEYLDFPDLIKLLISRGEAVKAYPYEGYWLDIGRPDDYEKANEEIDRIFATMGN